MKMRPYFIATGCVVAYFLIGVIVDSYPERSYDRQALETIQPRMHVTEVERIVGYQRGSLCHPPGTHYFGTGNSKAIPSGKWWKPGRFKSVEVCRVVVDSSRHVESVEFVWGTES